MDGVTGAGAGVGAGSVSAVFSVPVSAATGTGVGSGAGVGIAAGVESAVATGADSSFKACKMSTMLQFLSRNINSLIPEYSSPLPHSQLFPNH